MKIRLDKMDLYTRNLVIVMTIVNIIAAFILPSEVGIQISTETGEFTNIVPKVLFIFFMPAFSIFIYLFRKSREIYTPSYNLLIVLAMFVLNIYIIGINLI